MAIKVIMVAFIYFLSAKAVAPLPLIESENVFAIWPPTGIALGALFLYGYRIWPGIFLGSLFINLTISPFTPSIQIAITNTLGPIVGLWFLNKYNKDNIFYSVKMMMLFLVSISIASLITASGGTLTIYLHGLIQKEAIYNVWSSWFIGDLIGFLLLTPLVDALSKKIKFSKSIISPEGGVMILLLAVVILFIFGPLSTIDLVAYPIVYFLLPPLIWSALRFGATVAVFALIATTLASIYGTVLGYGPFIREDLDQTLLLLQSFNGITSITILIMSAIFHEREFIYKKLKSSHEMLRKLTKNVPGVIYQYKLQPDGQSSFPYASDEIQEIYEVNPQDVVDNAEAVFNILHPQDLERIISSIQTSAETMCDWNIQYRVDLPKKGVRWLEGFSKPEKLDDGSILWHGYIHDITNRKNTESQIMEQKDSLYYQAHHDDLTELPNRTLFQDRLNQAMKKAKRAHSKVALLFIDLDHFKEINDSLGHDVGDEVLKVVTTRLNKCKRAEDTLARLGGDEFTIIVEDLHHVQGASFIAKKILESLSLSINVNDNALYVSSSIGISIYPDDGKSTQSLLKFADSAMYKAKDEGRNNFQYYNTTLTELAFERIVMEASLRDALKNEEFVVYYQAQVNGMTNTIIGMEALVRWQHPTMNLISPAKFIPLAESTGLIVELDRYVMKTAMTQIARWYKDGLNPGMMSMNLAMKQLKQEDLIVTIENLILETGSKAQWMELEVTESQIMTDPDEAIKVLEQISDLGIELAIDDFGTGYSSLAYLKKLPIDKLKIDQTFIRDLPGNEDDIGITKAVIALAKSLNLKVIAEGVETKEQKDFLVANGCENIQGYFYSKPLPTSEMESFLKNR